LLLLHLALGFCRQIVCILCSVVVLALLRGFSVQSGVRPFFVAAGSLCLSSTTDAVRSVSCRCSLHIHSNMSWDGHLAKLTSAAKVQGYLVGLDGTKWAPAAPQAGDPTKDQLAVITAAFANAGPVRASGPILGATKYMITRADDQLIIGKKGTSGFIATKSAKSMQIALFDEANITPAAANIAVQKFSDYIKGIGF